MCETTRTVLFDHFFHPGRHVVLIGCIPRFWVALEWDDGLQDIPNPETIVDRVSETRDDPVMRRRIAVMFFMFVPRNQDSRIHQRRHPSGSLAVAFVLVLMNHIAHDTNTKHGRY